MTSCLLSHKRFCCREWAFSKINHCLENRQTSKTCGALVMGGPGCGKTALCCELVWPTVENGRQVGLHEKILAFYFCQAHDIETLSLTSFIHALVDQISKCSQMQGYQEQLRDPAVQGVLDHEACEKDPDEAFKTGVLMPLHSIPPPPHSMFLLVDSIDESYLQSIGDHTVGSQTIAELLANHHHLFPQWLLLIATARKQSKTVTRLFTGFRKISLDDLRKSHVVRDVQHYILCRLDQEENLRQHLSRETAEMLNQLHIKSNGCFLYLEKVLDGVAENFVMLREIREIPGTLNGLYLWLCQRLFVRKQFAKIQPILNVILAARRPLTELELYYCAYTRNTSLTFVDFKKRLELLSQLLIDGKDGTKILFHHSFAEWLLDVKHCTQRFMCNAAEGHGMLAMSFTMNAPNLTPVEVQDFALHLSKSNLQPDIKQYHQALWLLQSGASVEESLKSSQPKEQVVMKLLHLAGARATKEGDEGVRDGGAVGRTICATTPKMTLKELLNSGGSVNQVDSNGRTLLCNAAFLGEQDQVSQLLDSNVELEIEDKSGQTALNLASRQGHIEVVQVLLKAGANVNHTDHDGWTALRSASWGGHTDVVCALLEAGAEVDHADSDQRTALRAASWGGHDDIVLKLIEYGAELNKVDNEGRTALIAAAYMGHTEIVEHLLDHGANINHEDCDGRTALSVASLCIPASEGHSSVVSLLLERGTEVDHQDHDGMTPLLVAAYEGHHEVCELLLESDADVDHADNNGRTPLQAAASMGHSRVVNLLLFWGAAIDTIDMEGRTVLSIAAAQGNVEVVQQLLDRGLDELHRDNAGLTPLHIAAVEGRKEACECLIEAGARVMEVDNEGRIALNLAAQEGQLEACRVLVEHGSSVNHNSHEGKSPLRAASLEGHREVAQYLVMCGAQINYQDADGRTTLYLLSLENQTSVAELLIETGADMELPDVEGRTPLHVASWQGHYEMCELLLNREANIDAVDNDCRTALQSAAWQGHVGIVHLLLEHGAHVDHTCNQGATALCIAAQEGHEDVVKVLLKFKANPNHADQYGRTAIRVALKGGHSKVVKILEEHGASPLNGLNSRSGQMTTPPDIGAYGKATSAQLSNSQICNNKSSTKLPCDSPASTSEQRKSYFSNYTQSSKSSSNLTTTNSNTSTHPSSASTACAENDMSASFMQQLQQCSDPRNRNRPLSHVLSPVSEPQSPVQSPLGSPVSEVKTVIPRVSPAEHAFQLPPKPSPKHDIGASNGGMRIIANPNAEIYSGYMDAEEPVWLRHSDLSRAKDVSNAAKLALQRKGSLQERSSAGVIMGQAALAMKSPETRRKQNGIVSNPSYGKSGSVNGFLGTVNEGMDNFPSTPNGNFQGGSGTAPAVVKPKAVRPTGLPLKKETPL